MSYGWINLLSICECVLTNEQLTVCWSLSYQSFFWIDRWHEKIERRVLCYAKELPFHEWILMNPAWMFQVDVMDWLISSRKLKTKPEKTHTCDNSARTVPTEKRIWHVSTKICTKYLRSGLKRTQRRHKSGLPRPSAEAKSPRFRFHVSFLTKYFTTGLHQPTSWCAMLVELNL